MVAQVRRCLISSRMLGCRRDVLTYIYPSIRLNVRAMCKQLLSITQSGLDGAPYVAQAAMSGKQSAACHLGRARDVRVFSWVFMVSQTCCPSRPGIGRPAG
jgi:hypothetical protein